MAYPEKGAGYVHKPKFIERMKRAEGGPVNPATANVPASKPITPEQADYDQRIQQGLWAGITNRKLGK